MASPELHLNFHITAEEAGRRLDEVLASRVGSLSRMRIAALLDEGACMVNQGAGAAGYRVASGDFIELAFDHATPTAMSPEPIPLEIIHEDPCILVVVKPAGMLVHPTRGVKTGTLVNALAYHLNQLRLEGREFSFDSGPGPFSDFTSWQPVIRPGLVHRLDRATSGLMVIAKTQRALTILSRHFHRRLVEKRYLALVRGNVAQDSLEIVAPIGRDADRRPRWGVMASGRHAKTLISVRHRMGDSTLLELEPVTGRTNQLRIHCASAGHPVVGDDLYGGCEEQGNPAKPHVPISGSEIEPQSSRLCLHAWRLAFHHPTGGTWMEFTSDLPGDWPETGRVSLIEIHNVGFR